MQFLGKTFRETGIPEGLLSEKLGGEYSGELSMVALQEKPFKLVPKEHHTSIFIASYLPDHPTATSALDLKQLPDLMKEFQNEILISESERVYQHLNETSLIQLLFYRLKIWMKIEINQFF